MAILSLFLAIFLNFLATIFSFRGNLGQAHYIATPSAVLNASPSAVVKIPATSEPVDQPPSVPWGTTEQVGEHQYRTFVGNDPAMGSPDEILQALNSYRASHGTGQLQSDAKLCGLAEKRAQNQDKTSSLDGHQGLIEYMNVPNHWTELGVTAIGENASYGYVLSGVHLIEWVFNADAEHRDNQLNPNWTLACAGISGKTVDIIFGKR